MVMVRRRTFLAGILAGAAALALRALPAAAQSVALKQALLGFEDGVSWAAVSPVFAAQRPIWLNNVRGSRSPSELGAQLLRLEAAMGWSSVQNSWRTRRAAWVAAVQAASSEHAVAALLVELEGVTQWSAMRPVWRTARAAWLARASAI
ncbi:MAG: hypothetical protein IPF99_32955 [Deltaproteobacteria bacterium]|jgi:hypothetical protein|nr:hypothetical protein [Deltaproteobacteria bacterium]MBP6831187.1 hypothetical protein [Deltaproteobacteria bacterium]